MHSQNIMGNVSFQKEMNLKVLFNILIHKNSHFPPAL